jgi:hypothetical protein
MTTVDFSPEAMPVKDGMGTSHSLFIVAFESGLR